MLSFSDSGQPEGTASSRSPESRPGVQWNHTKFTSLSTEHLTPNFLSFGWVYGPQETDTNLSFGLKLSVLALSY